MFVGQARHKVNKDGRVSIPSKMRDVLSKKYNSEELYLLLMPEKFICLFPVQEFEKLASRFDYSQETSLSRIMDMERGVCGRAEVCTIDASGRIVIPPDMKQAAKIESTVIFIGARSHIEIWSPESLNEKYDRLESDRLLIPVINR